MYEGEFIAFQAQSKIKKADGLSAFGEKAGIYSRPPDRALGLLLLSQVAYLLERDTSLDPLYIALSSPQEENPPA